MSHVSFAIVTLLAGRLAGEDAAIPPVTHVEQPTGIDLAQYLEVWPGLEPAVVHLREGARDEAKSDLRRVSAAPSSDGALNLLAQLEREDGKLDDSEALIGKAIASNPKQHLHHFQQAMIFFVHLSRASGAMSRWSWHRKTRDAYQRAFDLDPRPVPYRYYLVYTFLQSPGIAGGDKNKALRMAQEGIDRGQKEFYVVRADVHRLRGEQAPAFSDYDRAIAERTFKLNSFIAAGQLALEKKEPDRARRYFEWAVTCRPDSALAREKAAKLSDVR